MIGAATFWSDGIAVYGRLRHGQWSETSSPRHFGACVSPQDPSSPAILPDSPRRAR